MKNLKKIILYGFDFLYLLKKNLEKAIFKKPSFCLRVLIYHDVKSKSQIELFKNQILSLRKEYDFISPNEFLSLLFKLFVTLELLFEPSVPDPKITSLPISLNA